MRCDVGTSPKIEMFAPAAVVGAATDTPRVAVAKVRIWKIYSPIAVCAVGWSWISEYLITYFLITYWVTISSVESMSNEESFSTGPGPRPITSSHRGHSVL